MLKFGPQCKYNHVIIYVKDHQVPPQLNRTKTGHDVRIVVLFLLFSLSLNNLRHPTSNFEYYPECESLITCPIWIQIRFACQLMMEGGLDGQGGRKRRRRRRREEEVRTHEEKNPQNPRTKKKKGGALTQAALRGGRNNNRPDNT